MGDSAIKRERPLDGEPRESVRQEVAAGGSSLSGELAHTNSIESSNGELQRSRRLMQPSENPLAGFWSTAEWIYCQDGKYRAVEPGSFPLAHGVPARVGRLRGYGNAINAEVAKTFIEAYMEIANASVTGV
jgi:DNA (cytosine-5)-methyltransferase 1